MTLMGKNLEIPFWNTVSGFYHAGPSAVEAIKSGSFGLGQDTRLFFTEVNAKQSIFLCIDEHDQEFISEKFQK